MTAVRSIAAPPGDWSLCPDCRAIRNGSKFARNLRICPECGHHDQLSAWQRIGALFDYGSVVELDAVTPPDDPLGFIDTRPYQERLREARERTGLRDAVVCVRGTVHDKPLIAAVMDFGFLGGSLGTAVGEQITACAETAMAERIPLLLVSASGGARMQEGALSLMQMVKTSQALGRLDEAGILTISLVTDPTYGGVAASFASLADVIISEPGARLGFAGRRVIMQTIRQNLPENFQTAEFLVEHGLLDMITPRPSLRRVLARLLSLAEQRATVPRADWRELLIEDPEVLPDREPWECVQRARDLGRPGLLDFAGTVFEDFLELRGDRHGGDCAALVGGLGRLGGRPVVVLGHHKGHDGRELHQRSFGMASPAGYRKAVRLMRLAAKLRLPVVTLIDTPGAYPGMTAEEQGQSLAIAESIRLMSRLPVPTIAVITGEGGSGGALALAAADRVYSLPDATYSVISPEGCASILWKDASAAPMAAAVMGVDARRLLALGIIDGVLAAHDLPAILAGTLAELAEQPAAELVARRYERFRRYGAVTAAVSEMAHG
jgi:acetyl-CoA carboxylase carboxyl transferase beta subunit/acetyl-CoA carboxylase carboxyl transferase alpha subunit